MIDLSLVPEAWLYLMAAIVGLILGSFFNVVVVRLPKMMELAWQRDCAEAKNAEAEKAEAKSAEANHAEAKGKPLATPAPFNLAVPASHCPKCGAAVRAWDNIPLISFVLLRGRCRHCKTPIHWRYPALELTSAIIPVICLMVFGLNGEALAYTVMLWMLLILSSIDLDHMLLPDQLTLPLLWLGLLGAISVLPVTPGDAIIGAVAGYLFLWSLFWVFKLLTGKEGLGYGDFKLLAALGAWLGWQMLPLVVLLGSLGGAVIGIGLMLLKRQQQGSPIPFGPFLALGGVIALFAGDALYQWYWQWAGWA